MVKGDIARRGTGHATRARSQACSMTVDGVDCGDHDNDHGAQGLETLKRGGNYFAE